MDTGKSGEIKTFVKTFQKTNVIESQLISNLDFAQGQLLAKVEAHSLLLLDEKIAKDSNHLSAIAKGADKLYKDDLIIQELPEEYDISILG